MNFGFSASYIALWALVVFQGLVALALLKQLTELRRLVEQGGLLGEDWLPVGSPAPEFAGLDFRSGRHVSNRDLNGREVVILFLSACDVCIKLADNLRQAATNGLPPIVAFCRGGERSCAGIVKALPPEIHLLLESAEDTAARYRASRSPTTVVVDGKRRIRGYGHPENVEDLKRLLASSLGAGSRENPEEKLHLVAFNSGATQ